MRQFKTNQDAFNEKKFIQSENYVDDDGIIKTEKLPPGVSEVVLIHVVDEDETTKYYTDNDGAKTSEEVTEKKSSRFLFLEVGEKMAKTDNETSKDDEITKKLRIKLAEICLFQLDNVKNKLAKNPEVVINSAIVC